MRLPLTLAIINGFQVGVGKSVFVVPLDMVDECIEFSAEPGHDYTNLRGQVLPFIRLRELFEVAGAPARAREHRRRQARRVRRPAWWSTRCWASSRPSSSRSSKMFNAGQVHQRLEHSGQRRRRADPGRARC